MKLHVENLARKIAAGLFRPFYDINQIYKCEVKYCIWLKYPIQTWQPMGVAIVM